MDGDAIRVNALLAQVLLHSGACWPAKGSKPTLQPVTISFSIQYDVRAAAATDNLTLSLDYSAVSAEVKKSVSPQNSASASPSFRGLEDLTAHVLRTVFSFSPEIHDCQVTVKQLRGPSACKYASVIASSTRSGVYDATVSYEDIECRAIIGINPIERAEKQPVKIQVSIKSADNRLDSEHWISSREMVKSLTEMVEASSYLTLEALASSIAALSLQHLYATWPRVSPPTVNVSAAKPSALVFAKSSEVRVSRTWKDYPLLFSVSPNHGAPLTSVPAPSLSNEKDPHLPLHTAIISLGSNLGDRFRNIEYALRLLEIPSSLIKSKGVPYVATVQNTSFLYETSPMYVTEQPSFVNCACILETDIPPIQLLEFLKKIEARVGRLPSIRNGPRAVDLDILYYDDMVLDTYGNSEAQTHDHLVIPHPRICEREFVLRPLNDMVPELHHPKTGKTVEAMLDELLRTTGPDPNTKKVLPFPKHSSYSSVLHSTDPMSIESVPETLTHWSTPLGTIGSSRKTHIMATLNVTPDSFSDGSINNSIPAALVYVETSVKYGASIVDIGGYSTRPGANFVSVEEEISRVVPIVEALRAKDSVSQDIAYAGLISVDTFRPEVAEAAILAGVNCINDVYAFTGPNSFPYNPENKTARECMTRMKALAKKYATPVILMHSRDEATQNKDYSEYKYVCQPGKNTGSVIEAVQVELGMKVDDIVRGAGALRRWLVIADPGIGFSKTLEGNLEILREAAKITANKWVGTALARRKNPLVGYPQLIGPSRKSFLGSILSAATGDTSPANERDWATTAAVSCAIQQRVDVVRVHNVKAMADVVKTADALWSW